MRTVGVAVVMVVAVWSAATGVTRAQDFTTIVGTPETSDDRYSEGSSWGDINGDGHVDLFVPHLYAGDTNVLFTNNGDGSFSQVTGDPVVDDLRSSGGSFGDFDNDGDLDLFVSNYFGDDNSLYLNDGNGAFTRVTTGAIVNDGGQSFGSSVADFDGDGWLDVFVVNGFLTNDGEANFLYRNNGDGTFTKIETGALVTNVARSSSAAWCDYDDDGDVDVFLANGGAFTADVIENILYRNDGDGTFSRLTATGVGIAHSYASNGSWGDYDNDGDFDLVVTNFIGNDNSLYRNNGDGTFTSIAQGIVVQDGGDSVSATWGDYDNDGWLDLYVTNDFGEDNFLYRNNGDGTFQKIGVGDPVMSGGRSNGATWADYDRDGFLDLFVPNGERPVTQSNNLYRNNGVSGNNWINIDLEGIASNRSAIGARVRAMATIGGNPVWQLRQVSGSTGFNAQNSLAAEFGFGDAASVDSLVIEWPSGAVDAYSDLSVSTFYKAVEGRTLSAVSTTSVLEEPTSVDEFVVLDHYPNPVRGSATISFESPRTAPVSLEIFDSLGRRVRAVETGRRAAGRHQVSVDVSGLPPAVYFVRLRTGDRTKISRMVVVR